MCVHVRVEEREIEIKEYKEKRGRHTHTQTTQRKVKNSIRERQHMRETLGERQEKASKTVKDRGTHTARKSI